MPDADQRNWAAEKLFPVIAPAPKPVEMTVDNAASEAELNEATAKLSTEELLAIDKLFSKGN